MFHSLLAQWQRTSFSEEEGICGLYQKNGLRCRSERRQNGQNKERA